MVLDPPSKVFNYILELLVAYENVIFSSQFDIKMGNCCGSGSEGSSKIYASCCVLITIIIGIAIILVVAIRVDTHQQVLVHAEPVTYYQILPLDGYAISFAVFLGISIVIAFCCKLCFDEEWRNLCSKIWLLCVAIIILTVIGLLSFHGVHKFDSDRLESNIQKNMLAKINSTHSNSTDTILDNIQQKFKCCGVKGPSDWQTNGNFDNKTVPDSCCKVERSDCGKNYRPNDIFLDGCLTNIMEKITVYFRWVIGFLVFFSFIPALPFFIGLCYSILSCPSSLVSSNAHDDTSGQLETIYVVTGHIQE